MLTANEAFLVREAVREKIETLRDAVRHESAKHPHAKTFSSRVRTLRSCLSKNAQRSGVLVRWENLSI